MQWTDAFPASDFEQWADSYDNDLVKYDAFPFAGYDRVLEAVVQLAAARAGMTVLDAGIGTGNLALQFAQLGCRVWGSDYSPAMLTRARRKLPEAELILHDLRAPWPPELDRRFERIVSAYTFHHFELDRKVALASELVRARLETNGRLVIADLSFPSGPSMREFATSIGDLWEDEHYWLADEAQEALKQAGLNVEYEQVSPCAGVYRIEGR